MKRQREWVFCVTCWVKPEVPISQHHEQQLLAQKLREAQRDVSVLSVWIVPAITCSAAEPPQLCGVQPDRHKHSNYITFNSMIVV